MKANWHADIVERALAGFLELVPRDDVDVFDVPGVFALPPRPSLKFSDIPSGPFARHSSHSYIDATSATGREPAAME